MFVDEDVTGRISVADFPKLVRDGTPLDVGVMVAARKRKRPRKRFRPFTERHHLGEQARRVERVEQIAGDRREVGPLGRHPAEPVRARVEIGEQKNAHRSKRIGFE